MTRINTNVQSIVAQQTLQKSNMQLNEALTRLSTGLRINKGKDDPAGLIASEVLRSDIISVERAITNSERANQLIATADSALGQVSSLLNDIRGLVSEAANTGALSDEQIAANQLQVDSSLEAIDRIAQTTSFQGRRLLDGSLDFLSTAAGTVDTTASGEFGGVDDANATLAMLDQDGTADTGLVFTAKDIGTDGNGYKFDIVTTGTENAETVTISGTTVTIAVEEGKSTVGMVLSAVQADVAFSKLFDAALNTSGAEDGSSLVITTGGADSTVGTSAGGTDGDKITISAAAGGTEFNNVEIQFISGGTQGAEVATFTAASTTTDPGIITVTIEDDKTTAAEVATAINALGDFNASASATGAGTFSAADEPSGDVMTTDGTSGSVSISNLVVEQANFGTASSIALNIDVDTQATKAQISYQGADLAADTVLEVGGSNGFEVFNFGSGTTKSQIQDALNMVSDSTGVTASIDGTSGDLVLTSSEYGSNEFVTARALSGSFTTVDADNTTVDRDNGTDVSLRINGVKATGDGLKASLNTSTLDLSFTVDETVGDDESINFSITGGGATFQLGPDVVSNQQARIGIRGVSSATLGGTSGTLFELRSGGSKSLGTDATQAGKVVEEVITAVTQLRGRLGAFQKATLETNIFSLSDQLENLSEAESSIRDADFAAESARLTRAQILVQSGTSVLGIANSNPQNVLSLLR